MNSSTSKYVDINMLFINKTISVVPFSFHLLRCIILSATVVILTYLLYCSRYQKSRMRSGLGTSIKIFFIYHAVGCALSTLSTFNATLFNTRYLKIIPFLVVVYVHNIDILFVLGTGTRVYSVCSALPTFFLTLDRYSTIQFRWVELSNAKSRLIVFNIIFTIASVLLGTFFLLLELPLDYDKLKNCLTFGCLCVRYKTIQILYMKSIFVTVNFLFSFYFLLCMRSKVYLSKSDKIVKLTILLDFAFSVFPSVAFQLIVMNGSAQLIRTTGETMGMISVHIYGLLINTLYFARIFLKSLHNKKTLRIQSMHNIQHSITRSTNFQS